ncbi:Ig-like domain-containing protein [Wenzhouxiangella marina]|nr:Ig-like domain-containing protein [Wenzhouxiangella marina]MBB6087290.1 DNA-binding beta-propeller fold protein YncE [Wenzhouxiangella marina]
MRSFAWGLLLTANFAVAQHSDPGVPSGFPNVPQTAGALISSGLIAPTQGRTAIIAYHNGVLVTIPEAPSSNPGSDLQVRTWDISTPERLVNPLELAQHGATPMPINAHGYFKNGNWLSIGDNRDWDPGLEPWAFEAVPGGLLRSSNPDFLCAGVRGCLFAPWAPMGTFWSYSAVEGNAALYLDGLGPANQVAEWDHLGQTGVIGHPFLIGNLLIYASDQSQTGVATYDISDPGNPVLLDVLTESAPGGYWPELWGGGGQLYVVFPYRAGGNGMRVVDVTDPADLRFLADVPLPGDEAMYAQFQDEFAFIGSWKIDMRSFEPVVFFDPDTAWSNAYGSGDRISTSQFALPIGNLLVTGGAAPDHGMAIWAHQDAPDTRGPEVGFHIPRSGQTGWPTNRLPVSLLIHEEIETPTLINGDTFIVRPLDGAPVSGTLTFAFDDILTFTPDQPWMENTTYEVILPGGGIKDAAGNGIQDYAFSFSTGGSVGGNTAPTVTSFGPSAHPIQPGQTISLSATASDAEGGPLEYRFDFGDGSPKTPWSGSASVQASWASSGHYSIAVQVRDPGGMLSSASRRVTVVNEAAGLGRSSAPLVCDGGTRRVYTVNPDNNSLTAVDADSLATVYEVPVCADPRSVARAGAQLWVACHDDDILEVRDAATGGLVDAMALDYGSAPIALAVSPDAAQVYVSLSGSGELLRFDASTRLPTGALALGPSAGALAISADGSQVYVARFLSELHHAEVWEVDTSAAMSLARTLRVRRIGGPENVDGTGAGRGVPNYLSGMALDRDGAVLWVSANKANTERGLSFEDDLDSDNTVRAILFGIDLADGSLHRHIDIDNSDSPAAVALSPLGDYLLVPLQGNNEVTVFDALGAGDAAGLGGLVGRLATGPAPQGACSDPVTGRSFVKNFLGRSLSVLETAALFDSGSLNVGVSTVSTVASEAMPATVLNGKRIFYNASDPRMSSEGYLSCATCHFDGGHDGRTWDFHGRGEGMRNTTSLRGRAGMGQGNVHWSANFDEIQDFELDIRGPFGGQGFLSPEDFAATADPLGAPKAGLSADLDALADYVSSLGSTHLPRSPYRNPDGSETASAAQGRQIFIREGCQQCHGGAQYSDSRLGPARLHDVGTLRTSSGFRLGEPLEGIDTPTLLGVWATAPYFHDGSAASLAEVFSVAGGPVIQGEDAALAGGATVFADWVWPLADFSIKQRYAAQFDVPGATATFAQIDGGAGGTGAVEVRYSASYGASHDFQVEVNGQTRTLTLPATGNDPQWLFHVWRTARVEDVPFAPGLNTVILRDLNGGYVAIDEVTITTPAYTNRAEPHRRVGALPVAEMEALIDFLEQLDGSSPAAPAFDAIFWDRFD